MVTQIFKVFSVIILTVSSLLGLLFELKTNGHLNSNGIIYIIIIVISSIFAITTEILEYKKKLADSREQVEAQKKIVSNMIGGDSFCYLMFYNFNFRENYAREFLLGKEGDFPLYDVRVRIIDMHTRKQLVNSNFGEINSPAVFLQLKWELKDSNYYRIFFSARNGFWTQDLILVKSISSSYWPIATKVKNRNGKVIFEKIEDPDFSLAYGEL